MNCGVWILRSDFHISASPEGRLWLRDMLKLRPASETWKFLETGRLYAHAGMITVLWVLGEVCSNSGLTLSVILSNLFYITTFALPAV
jgi:hypothetical protein